MSEVIDRAVEILSARLTGGFDGIAKFVIDGEGAIMLDEGGVRAGDAPAEVTLTASADVFRAILDGETSATSAFMSGRLTVDGDMGQALRLGAVLG